MPPIENPGAVQHPGTQIPDTDPNPLNFPILERDLGRWAQVYFTTPPDKRHEAVGALINELRNEKSQLGIEPHITQSATPKVVSLIQCPKCQSENRLEQKFCGRCGWPLRQTKDAPATLESVSNIKNAIAEPQEAMEPRPDPITDVTAIRDALKVGSSTQETPRTRKYAVVGVALVAVIAALLFLRLNHQSESPALAQPVPVPPRNGIAQPLASSTNPPSYAVSSSSPSRLKAQKDSPRQTNPAPATPASDQAAAPSAPGADELAQAKTYMNGTGGQRDPVEAASWLWKAVRKRNATAALLLANMYRLGDGVGQSCDQARLLFAAAAADGSDEAAQQLRDLQTQGCK